MNAYIIFETNVEGYVQFVLCLSSESLITYIDKIEDTLAKNNTSGRILFDQLLFTGNNTNRFMSCDFSEGRLNFGTAHMVTPTYYFQRKTVDWLHDNYSYVENSILTEAQRQKIKENIIL